MKFIGRYRICGLLGRGGMGSVYRVRMPVTGRIAALKVLRPHPTLKQLQGEARLRRQFRREATLLSELRHPNVIQVWDYDESGEAPFFLMDYFSHNLGDTIGETYRTEIPSRRLPVERAVGYVRQTLEGLARLHYAGLVHRDIKPFNLLLDDRDTVKICDFGLSLLRGETGSWPSNLKVGTPWYAAPEQEENPDGVDGRTDLYATGVILYRMLTGRLPDSGGPPPSRLNPDLDEDWDRFFRNALAGRRRKRFSSAAEMARELDGLYGAWSARVQDACRLAPEFPQSAGRSASALPPLRHRPFKVGTRQAREALGLDALWRPRNWTANDFIARGERLVYDRLTGLLWERGGTPYPGGWRSAHRHVAALNRSGVGGRRDWRLPTAAELISVLSAPPQGSDLCTATVFTPLQTRLWSADRKSWTAAWYVSLDLGFVHWQDFTASIYTKGVCGPLRKNNGPADSGERDGR